MSTNVVERIQAEITENPVMLYMKGTPMLPMCGFSARVVQILNHLTCRSQTANVLEDAGAARRRQAVLAAGRRSRSFMSMASSSAAATS